MLTGCQSLVRILASVMVVTAIVPGWASAAEPVTRVLMETSFGNSYAVAGSREGADNRCEFCLAGRKRIL